MNSECHYAVLILGSNFRRSANLKKGLSLIEKRYSILKTSRLYKSDDTTQRGGFYWNIALVIKVKKNDDLKNELINIEKECGRSWDSLKKNIALDVDIALIYSFGSSNSKCKVLTNNIDESLHSFLSLKDILPDELNIKNFLSDTQDIGSQIRSRQINFVSIYEISNGYHHVS